VFQTTVNSRTFSRRSLHGQVAHKIAKRIISGEINPGEFLLTEEAASSGLNVSRTAYREALKVLAAKGLVESKPKTGTRVRPRSDWNMLDPDLLAWSFETGPSESFARSLFEFRQIIEPAAAAMAAERAKDDEVATMKEAIDAMKTAGDDHRQWVEADLAFHLSVLAATHNELLTSFGYLIESALAQSFELSDRKPGARSLSLPRHVQLYEYIAARDSAGAQSTMQQLLREARRDLEDVISAGIPARTNRKRISVS
jgi:DNA-binding FadR family transcriptional regulator